MPCVWEANGVIEVKDGKATLLRPRHFAEGQDGRKLHFYNDFFVPFAKRFADAIHDVSPEAMIFVEDAPFAPPGAPHMEWYVSPASWFTSLLVYCSSTPSEACGRVMGCHRRRRNGAWQRGEREGAMKRERGPETKNG